MIYPITKQSNLMCKKHKHLGGGIAEVLGCLQGEACFYILMQGMTEIRQKCIRGLLSLNTYKWIVIMMPNFRTLI